MKQELEASIAAAVHALFDAKVTVELTRPEEQFGDYATNVALQLSKQVGKNPREIGEALAEKLRTDLHEQVSEVSVAGPGFLNLKLTDAALIQGVSIEPAKSLAGKTVVAEYSDPNPFKVLHAGHLYTSVVGDAIANLLENAGAKVHRVNFGGDVGLHVGKTMWGMLHKLRGANEQFLDKVEASARADWLADAYVIGNEAYDKTLPIREEGGFARLDGDLPKLDILLLNHIIYDYWGDKAFASDSHQFKTAINSDELIPTASIYRLYEIGREWSYDYFDSFYAQIGSHFEKYYPESETAGLGLETVRKHVDKVYQESEGAIVFDGEKHGLHTRVFINSEGLPTYEAKDVGLIMKKWQDYKFDLSVVITGNDIVEYMKVVLKSIEQFQPELPQRTRHLTHGIVKLQGGVKMSSRLGNILRAQEVLDAAAEANKAVTDQDNKSTVLGAVKYAFLKNRIGGDVIYDPKESVSLEGNSGPYLQYAHARACSILRKSTGHPDQSGGASYEISRQARDDIALEAGERTLVRKLSEYAEVVDQATAELMPHHIAGYLYELAQTFNRFYEHNRVIGDEREALRLSLVKQYAITLKNGLNLLSITAPDKM